MAADIPKDVSQAQKAAKAINVFASNLFKVLAQKGSSENIFFSPMSISTALAMTYLGARGNTSSQMSQVLQFNVLEESQLHQSFAELSNLINRTDASYTLKAAIGLFGHKNFELLQAFRDETKKFYGAEMEMLDFGGDAEGSRTFINGWVEKQTKSRIKDLLAEGSLDALTRLVLVNAIYFEGDWAAKFQILNTIEKPFLLTGRGYVSVAMMCQKGEFPFSHDPSVKCSIIELPYIKKEVSMFIVLPDEFDGLGDVLKELSHEKLEQWISQTRSGPPPEVNLSLPRFTLQQDFVLNDVLKAMGMIDPFDSSQADFSGMTGGKDLFISTAIHKAFLEVSEKGSRAATSKGLIVRAGIEPERLNEFDANHPFLVLIRDNKSEAILFMGQLCNPRAFPH